MMPAAAAATALQHALLRERAMPPVIDFDPTAPTAADSAFVLQHAQLRERAMPLQVVSYSDPTAPTGERLPALLLSAGLMAHHTPLPGLVCAAAQLA